MMLWQTSWSQNGLPKSDPNSKYGKAISALVNCDNDNQRLRIDLKIAIESDSNKTVLLGLKDKRIKNDSSLVVNLKKQEENYVSTIITQQKHINVLEKRANRKWWYIGGGAVGAFILNTTIRTLITKLK